LGLLETPELCQTGDPMPPKKAGLKGRRSAPRAETSFNLKQLSDHLNLAPATISLVLNGSPVAKTIASDTQKRIRDAAREFNYRPNFFARCLRTKRSFTIGVMVPEVSEGYNATVLSGIEDQLMREGYFYFVASHGFKLDLIDEYAQLFLHRSVDGLIVVNTPWHLNLPIPVVTVSSHHSVAGVTSLVLDHHHAVESALQHLIQLGHRQIAFIKGQGFVPDTEIRWQAILSVAAQLGLPICPKLVTQYEDNSPSPFLGYEVTRKLLASGEKFTALFAFNDISAMGAIRALHELGLRVPEDVSVVGFDDIESAAYQNPGLTTVRQPMRRMGQLAAETVLQRISSPENAPAGTARITIETELIVRGTTSRISPRPGAAEKGIAPQLQGPHSAPTLNLD
jgi:DNA-binding LacI/PurR family transcriptional regulator